MFKPFLATLCTLILCFSSGRLWSVQVNNLYSATVPVVSQESADRDAALNEALISVLIKITGQPDIASQSGIVETLLPAQRYVLTFSYSDNPDYLEYLRLEELVAQQTPATQAGNQAEQGLFDAIAAEAAAQVALPDERPLPYLLEASFSKAQVDEQLARLRIPVWGAVRPGVLVWLVDDSSGQREVIAAGHPHAEELKRRAEQYGLPLFFPVMDLQDISSVDVADLWGLFPDAVADASARYRADSSLLIRLSAYGSELWRSSWVFDLRNTWINGQTQETSRDMVWDRVLRSMAREFSERYAVLKTPGSGDVLNLQVEGVSTFGSYVALRQYLRGLPPVARAEVLNLDRSRVTYAISLRGTEQQFREYLELGGKMEPLQSDTVGVAASTVILQGQDNVLSQPFTLRYRWLKGL
ncbi:MAG: DUF2066 domain-containing protein [Oleiphilaceae bacterium]|nr:DUF2066 domain-containing protein [Oleiphilaceae bacterium]